ncbi:MAG: DUF6798 domain-containing protein [Planctomycetota bacterium]
MRSAGEVVHAEDHPLAVFLAIVAAALLCMAVTGYSFLAGNHEVYLLEPLRRSGLASFAGDPFVTETLQYHGLFSFVASYLFHWNVAEAGFLIIFLALGFTLAWAWWRVVRHLGGGIAAFLASVVAYHVFLGDRALGIYSMLQDGQFNAGNVAAVGLVVALAGAFERRWYLAAFGFGLAGGFHLNFSLICPPLFLLLAWKSGDRWRKLIGPGIVAIGPSVANVGVALPAKIMAGAGEQMSLARFVELYARLRHPHHYDPLVWPWWVWAVVLAPLPLAALAWWRHRDRWSLPGTTLAFFVCLQVVALVFAGIWYVNETMIQASLWRFSPHMKWLAVCMGSVWIFNESRRAQLLAAATLVVSLISLLIYRGDLEIPVQPTSGRTILQAAAWARAESPPDSLFLVPPGVGSAFPVNARRGHIVSFKLVPQLAGELEPWARRLGDVVGSDDITQYTGGFTGYEQARRAMDADYHARPINELIEAARRHDADYVVVLSSDAPGDFEPVFTADGVAIYEVP